MCRTARVLSAVVLAGAALVAVAPGASADPAAEVSPGMAAPGGSVTVAVTCDPLGAPAPQTLDASSEAFEEGAVQLALVPGNDELTGPAYRGTARIVPAADLGASSEAAGTESAWNVDGTCPAPPGGEGTPWSATFDVSRDDRGSSGLTGPAGPAGPSDPSVAPGPSCVPAHGTPCETEEPCGQDHTYSCPSPTPPAPPAPHSSCGHARPWQSHSAAPHGDSCTGAPIHHGVRAGAGGTFTDSVPALTAGALLIAGALAAAVHRLLRRDPRGHA
ncbi:hypothetical protein [Streptomyces sp. A012304]|uniref:hypothetical protein n=1 Tax=Streptomyces sp. A012304 TaxID=375446 RepID=UPI002231A077|nr:hypothetical protein [Streptomyces sp. A012304]GKQ39490.1 hypothetical protein ALMP_60170 [Streptomyces sp. A012304]